MEPIWVVWIKNGSRTELPEPVPVKWRDMRGSGVLNRCQMFKSCTGSNKFLPYTKTNYRSDGSLSSDRIEP